MPLIRAGKGRIVNIGSLAAEISTPFKGPYSASKAALRVITESLRRELAPWGIYAGVIEPGSCR